MSLVNEKSTIPVVLLMTCVTISVPIFIYNGIQKDKYDIQKYNNNNLENAKKQDEKTCKVCGVIMMSATMIFLATGFIYNIWHINWVVFPLGGILCGIVSTIIKKD